MNTIMITTIVSGLTYLLMRGLEWLWSAWKADKRSEIERLVDLIEEYKQKLDESYEDKATEQNKENK